VLLKVAHRNSWFTVLQNAFHRFLTLFTRGKTVMFHFCEMMKKWLFSGTTFFCFIVKIVIFQNPKHGYFP
jgi:hypothetical protein